MTARTNYMERTAIVFVALASAVIGLYAGVIGMDMLGARGLFRPVMIGLISAVAAALVSLSVSPRVAARVSRGWLCVTTIVAGVIFAAGAWVFRLFIVN
jgi:hypothetical protein